LYNIHSQEKNTLKAKNPTHTYVSVGIITPEQASIEQYIQSLTLLNQTENTAGTDTYGLKVLRKRLKVPFIKVSCSNKKTGSHPKMTAGKQERFAPRRERGGN
jgi:hypothetical protein